MDERDRADVLGRAFGDQTQNKQEREQCGAEVTLLSPSGIVGSSKQVCVRTRRCGPLPKSPQSRRTQLHGPILQKFGAGMNLKHVPRGLIILFLAHAAVTSSIEVLHYVWSLPLNQWVPAAFSLIVVAIAWLANSYFKKFRDAHSMLSQAGIVGFHRKAEETIESGLNAATHSYLWLGTSANYVVGRNQRLVHNSIETKIDTKFLFITLDPADLPAVSAQTKWQMPEGMSGNDLHEETDDMRRRICETRDVLARIHRHRPNVNWEGYGRIPTFRVFIVDDSKLFVSFYEKGKRGPDCADQLELRADSILGRWFMQFVEKSRIDAKLTHYQCGLLCAFLKDPGVPAVEVVQKFAAEFTDEDKQYAEQMIRQLREPTP
jgi:hypothetical protein